MREVMEGSGRFGDILYIVVFWLAGFLNSKQENKVRDCTLP